MLCSRRFCFRSSMKCGVCSRRRSKRCLLMPSFVYPLSSCRLVAIAATQQNSPRAGIGGGGGQQVDGAKHVVSILAAVAALGRNGVGATDAAAALEKSGGDLAGAMEELRVRERHQPTATPAEAGAVAALVANEQRLQRELFRAEAGQAAAEAAAAAPAEVDNKLRRELAAARCPRTDTTATGLRIPLALFLCGAQPCVTCRNRVAELEDATGLAAGDKGRGEAQRSLEHFKTLYSHAVQVTLMPLSHLSM